MFSRAIAVVLVVAAFIGCTKRDTHPIVLSVQVERDGSYLVGSRRITNTRDLECVIRSVKTNSTSIPSITITCDADMKYSNVKPVFYAGTSQGCWKFDICTKTNSGRAMFFSGTLQQESRPRKFFLVDLITRVTWQDGRSTPIVNPLPSLLAKDCDYMISIHVSEDSTLGEIADVLAQVAPFSPFDRRILRGTPSPELIELTKGR